MRATYFVDTGFFLALELSRDQNHSQAQRLWRQLIENPPTLVTTTFVLDEIVTFFNARGHHAKAVEVGEALLRSPSIDLVTVEDSWLALAWEYFRRHDDKRYSLTDCLSFVIMNERGLTQALGFDRHFVQAGFQLLPAS